VCSSDLNELLEKSSEAAKLEADVFIQVEKQRLEHELKNNQAILDQIAIKQEHLAKIAIEKWYEAELKNFTSSAVIDSSIKYNLEETTWILYDSPDKIEYIFKNGSLSEKELIIIENDQLGKGKWFYSNGIKKIAIGLPNSEVEEYVILELNSSELILKHAESNDILLFKNKNSSN
jgi:hypothetical protein